MLQYIRWLGGPSHIVSFGDVRFAFIWMGFFFFPSCFHIISGVFSISFYVFGWYFVFLYEMDLLYERFLLWDH